jgi:hypothetical protein
MVGGGPADRVILHATQVVAGISRSQMITVDVVAGTIERTGPLTTRPQILLDGPGVSFDGRLFVYDSNGQDVLSYDTLRPQAVQTLWTHADLELLEVVGLVPGTYDVLVNRRTGRLPPPPGSAGPPGIPLSPPALWRMPAGNPALRRELLGAYSGIVALRRDGQRLAYWRASTTDPQAADLVEIAVADGSILGVATPAGGVALPRAFDYLGSSADLVFAVEGAGPTETLLLARANEPGVLHRIGADRQYAGPVYFGFDDEATAIAFSVAESAGSGTYRAFLTDTRAPAVSVPVDVPVADRGDVFVWRVFGPPHP